MIVKIYSTPSCPYCFTLKMFLKEKNISFEEIDVSKDKAVADEMIKKSGQIGAPVIQIGDQYVVGFDKEKISKLLDIK